MEPKSSNAISLDNLATSAGEGDSRAEATLFASMRVRFIQVSKQRVREDDLEDVVQDALQIVHGKYRDRGAGRGILVWSLAVLRNVIGNYYQKKARQGGGEPFDDRLHSHASQPAPPDALLGQDGEEIFGALALLAGEQPRCGALFRRVLASLERGGDPAQINRRALQILRADYPGMSRGSLYVALHRCRKRLREILQRGEVA